jgi:hypothetical protein
MTTHTDATTLNNSNQTDHFLITTKNAGIIWKRITMDANHLVSMETLSRRQAPMQGTSQNYDFNQYRELNLTAFTHNPVF